ncbi:hypothetical protein GCM10023346_01930 [Arthrobacter gyeryongensis]|uniref:Uncharacterized protein n=1 Tax=Arthrobacter gyeryongensis TaxID=1650592 RepID=A0ABP9RXL3_9MICC
MPEVDAQQGYIDVADQLGSAQDGAVTAKNHDKFDILQPDILVEYLDWLIHYAVEPFDVVQFRLLHHRDQA